MRDIRDGKRGSGEHSCLISPIENHRNFITQVALVFDFLCNLCRLVQAMLVNSVGTVRRNLPNCIS